MSKIKQLRKRFCAVTFTIQSPSYLYSFEHCLPCVPRRSWASSGHSCPWRPQFFWKKSIFSKKFQCFPKMSLFFPGLYIISIFYWFDLFLNQLLLFFQREKFSKKIVIGQELIFFFKFLNFFIILNLKIFIFTQKILLFSGFWLKVRFKWPQLLFIL